MRHQANLDPGIGCRDIWVMPGGLCEVADGIDDHQRALPAGRLVCSPYPAVLKPPLGKVLLKPRGNLGVRHRLFAFSRHIVASSSFAGPYALSLKVMPLADATQTQPPASGSQGSRATRLTTGAVRVVAPARLHLG